MLLEKAVAKSFKNYENIESGDTGFAMNLLTGAPSEMINFKNDVYYQNSIFEMILESYNKKFLITTSSGNN